MAHSGGAGPSSSHAPMSAQAAMAAAVNAFAANGMVPPSLPSHSTAGGFPTPAGLPATSSNGNLLALAHPGFFPSHPLQMLGLRGVTPGSTSSLMVGAHGNKEEPRRPSDTAPSGKFKLIFTFIY